MQKIYFIRLSYYYVVCAIFILRLLAHSSPETIVTYNHTCDNERLCSNRSLLMCISGVCQCGSPSNQRYDTDTDTCLSLVGGRCTLKSAPDNIPMNCIPNAECVLVKSSSYNYTQCQCLEGYIENYLGKCVPGIGKPCSYGPLECNPLGMIVCKNGKCSCLDEIQVYDHESKRCVSPAGTYCKYENVQLGCVRHAVCFPFYHWVLPRCICKPGYIQTKNRTCILELEAMRMRVVNSEEVV